MVFSQTSLKARSTLKVVELDRLKQKEKNQQVNGSNGVITGGNTTSLQTLLLSAHPQPPPSSTPEVSPPPFVYLKPEPLFENTMFHESDCEFFQDLGPLCSGLAKEEVTLITDSPNKIEESVHHTDTLHTTFSPSGWDVFDANSPAQSGYSISTPNDPLSPNVDGFVPPDAKFLYSSDDKKLSSELDFDLSALPVIVENLAPEQTIDLNAAYITEPIDYFTSHYTTDNSLINTHNKMLYFDLDEFDMKLDTVKPTEVENNVVIAQPAMNNNWDANVLVQPHKDHRAGSGLSLDVNLAAPWSAFDISTPDVVEAVEKLEDQLIMPQKDQSLLADSGFISTDTCQFNVPTPEFKPLTPAKTDEESDDEDSKTGLRRHRKRVHDSEDSDATYTPHPVREVKRHKKLRRNIPIKDLINALEESQTQPKRRGRPPKRRDSAVSSTCSVDENASSASTQESKYRELRDKNNEASKRSRMNRKLKELQMEQLAIELEERNKKLKVKADILEDMTKRLKDALMTALLQK